MKLYLSSYMFGEHGSRLAVLRLVTLVVALCCASEAIGADRPITIGEARTLEPRRLGQLLLGTAAPEIVEVRLPELGVGSWLVPPRPKPKDSDLLGQIILYGRPKRAVGLPSGYNVPLCVAQVTSIVFNNVGRPLNERTNAAYTYDASRRISSGKPEDSCDQAGAPSSFFIAGNPSLAVDAIFVIQSGVLDRLFPQGPVKLSTVGAVNERKCEAPTISKFTRCFELGLHGPVARYTGVTVMLEGQLPSARVSIISSAAAYE